MSHGPTGLATGHRLVFIGDSLLFNPTEPNYGDYLTAYMVLANPTLTLHCQQFGFSGLAMEGFLDSSAAATYQHYRRYVAPLAPDYVFSMWADNGGYNKATFKGHAQSMVDDHIISIDGAAPILLGMIPQSDADGYPLGADYDDAIQEISEAATPDHAYARLWHALYETAPAVFADSDNWTALRWPADGSPGVHPSAAGTILASWQLITLLGWDTSVSQATIAANTLTLTSEADCACTGIVANAFGGIDFSRLDARLPWAIDETGPDGTGRADAVAMWSAIAGWQDYSLTVTGLAAGTYDVIIGGVTVAAVTHTALAAGWNMADLTTGPVWQKGQDVLAAIRDLHSIDPVALTLITSPQRYGVRDYINIANVSYEAPNSHTGAAGAADHLAYLSGGGGSPYGDKLAVLAGYDALIHTAAQPETLVFSLQRQGYTPAAAPTFSVTNHITPA